MLARKRTLEEPVKAAVVPAKAAVVPAKAAVDDKHRLNFLENSDSY
jgi:hypothetical protein